jgi:hypothetical protein
MIFSMLLVIPKNTKRGTCVRDLCDTALSAYDAEQTSRSSSYLWERGTRQKRHPLAKTQGGYVFIHSFIK